MMFLNTYDFIKKRLFELTINLVLPKLSVSNGDMIAFRSQLAHIVSAAQSMNYAVEVNLYRKLYQKVSE